MRRSHVRLLALLALPLLALACDGEPGPAGPGEELAENLRMDIVDGYGQYGRTGMYFPDHLRIMVTDADGDPVQGVQVKWEVTEGPLEVSAPVTYTNRFGRAKITARGAGRLGVGTIRASLAAAPQVAADFREEVSAYQVVMKSDQYQELTFSSDLKVQVGDTIEWLNKDMGDVEGGMYAMHTATSTRHPEGGHSFDSGKLGFDETYQFVPQTTGTWEYECDDHPQQEMMYGTIEVVARQ